MSADLLLFTTELHDGGRNRLGGWVVFFLKKNQVWNKLDTRNCRMKGKAAYTLLIKLPPSTALWLSCCLKWSLPGAELCDTSQQLWHTYCSGYQRDVAATRNWLLKSDNWESMKTPGLRKTSILSVCPHTDTWAHKEQYGEPHAAAVSLL